MPDDTQIDLRQTVAELRRELEARTTERDEALAREAAIAEVLQVINSSPGDLAPVFDAMLEKAARLCGAGFGILDGFRRSSFRTVATRDVPAAFAEYRAATRPTTGRAPAPARFSPGSASSISPI